MNNNHTRQINKPARGSDYHNTTCIGEVEVQAFKDIDTVIDLILPPDGRVRPGFAVAINPEKIIRASVDDGLKETLLSATIRYPDGVGVVMAMRQKNVYSARIPGADLWEALMKRAALHQSRVFLLGGAPGVLEDLIQISKSKIPNLNVVGFSDGYFSDQSEVLKKFLESKADILAVGMGSPRQENLIEQFRKIKPDCFYMGVGGTFDVFTGRVSRAPRCWQNLGLEWLYRLLRQPARIKRQKSLLVFAKRLMCKQF